MDSLRLDKLRQAWKNLCLPLDCLPLLATYAASDRGYHDLEHLEEVLGWVPHLPLVPSDRRLLQMALFYHDVVYNTRRADNERLSADWARRDLTGCLGPLEVDEVVALIMDTTHGQAPHNDLGAWMVDVDLAVLGSPWERFERYHHGVRREYSWVPWFLYRMRRRQVLRQFLQRPRIYLTDYFQSRLEHRARENLNRALQL